MSHKYLTATELQKWNDKYFKEMRERERAAKEKYLESLFSRTYETIKKAMK